MLINFEFVKSKEYNFETSRAAVSKYGPGPSGVLETLSVRSKLFS